MYIFFSQVEEFKAALKNSDKMDRFEIKSHLNKLCVTEVPRDETYQMRLLLQ